ncbi:glutamate-cysteine ligase family protein [Natronorubrum sp. DTA7]|uniref:glutamate-cysteine ligase family protein n=1 Tax=Natronorubrum sp. DTA7 TaxID=3447016 RepID=UPI003F84AE6E
MKLGLEVEYWVIDEKGALTSADALIQAHECVVPEFVDSLIEIVLPPLESRVALEITFIDVLNTVFDVATAHGKHLVPLGTPLLEESPAVLSKRGATLERIYGDDLQFAKNVAGMHVHFDQTDPIAQANLLTALDPALALVASSPYYGGHRTATAARATAYRRGMDERFHRFRELQPYVLTPEARAKQARENFESFLNLAADSGVPEATVYDQFSIENVIHSPVRIRDDLGTVEWRASDTALPSQLAQLAFDVARILEETATKPVVVGAEPGIYSGAIVVPPFEYLKSLSDEAIADGLTPRVRTYLEAFDIDPTAYSPLVDRFPRAEAISPGEARAMRLEFARLLRADVDRFDATNLPDDPSAARNTADDDRRLQPNGFVGPRERYRRGGIYTTS